MSINSFTQGGFTGSKKQTISGTQELPANDMLMEYYVMAGGGGGGNNRGHPGWGNHGGGKGGAGGLLMDANVQIFNKGVAYAVSIGGGGGAITNGTDTTLAVSYTHLTLPTTVSV